MGLGQGAWQELPCIAASTNYQDIPESSLECHGSFPELGSDLHYLRATLDPRAHLPLEAEVNGMAALALVDSSATRIFIHPQFAQECGAVVRPREYLHKVRVINGRVINSGLITHEASV